MAEAGTANTGTANTGTANTGVANTGAANTGAAAVRAEAGRAPGRVVDNRFMPARPGGRWRAWLNRRVPPRSRVQLHRGNVFIFPSRTGFAFLGLVGLLILAAINYENAMVFGLAFLLASTFALAIGHTYRNLAGLTLEAAGVRPVFAGEHAEFAVRLERDKGRAHHALWLGWPDEIAQNVDLDEEVQRQVHIPALAARRGWLDPGRMRLETTWPLGLLRAWTWLDLSQAALVYPRPLHAGLPRRVPLAGGEGREIVGDGQDDFVGLRPYRPGDSLKHIAWKSFAQEGEVMVKEFGGQADRRLWLDWEALPGMGNEDRLSTLCGWALSCEAAGDEYGLRLPGVEIEPGRGEGHRGRVLRALALHGLPAEPSGAGA